MDEHLETSNLQIYLWILLHLMPIRQLQTLWAGLPVVTKTGQGLPELREFTSCRLPSNARK